MRTAAALLMLAVIINTARAQADHAQVQRVEVRGPRIHARDVLGPKAPDVDLGATPPIGSSKVIERPELERAFAVAHQPWPKQLPQSIRVTRKIRHFDTNAVGTAARATLSTMTMPRGAKMTNVRASAAIDVGADYDHLNVDLPSLPRKAGPVTVHAPASFIAEDGATLATTLVSIDFTLPAEAAIADVRKGAPCTLLVKHGLVEVSMGGAVFATDADIGSIASVTLRPSGRVVRVRVTDRDHAVMEEK